MSNKPLSQQRVRDITGSAYDYNSDWLALFTQNGIATGVWGERFKRWDDARVTPISTTTISTPVNYVDLTLPSGFSAFRLAIIGLDGASPSWAFSQNAGSSWISNLSGDSNAYHVIDFYQLGDTIEGANFSDGIMYPTSGRTVLTGDFIIYPGSATRRATMGGFIYSDGHAGTFPADYQSQIRWTCRNNTARVDVLRVFYGYTDATNPALDTLDFGTLVLYGVD